ncbi:MAG TPA: hypothetical protein VGL42_07155 [Opitutaceae bacterium]|jgi:purine nucleoside permease
MFAVLGLLLGGAVAKADAAQPLAVKLVLITDAGHGSKEASTVYDRLVNADQLTQLLGVPGLAGPVRGDGKGTLLISVGAGVEAATQIVALGLDARFDFSHAYWLVVGTGQGNPDQMSLCSVVWAKSVVSGDEGFETDRADAAADWPYGIVPLTAAAPKGYPLRAKGAGQTVVYRLNARLARGASALSRDAALPDTPELRDERGHFAGYDEAVLPPSVQVADVVGTSRYWHGKVLTQWAGDWVHYWDGVTAKFAVADTSDVGIAAAIETLSRAGRADFERLMIARAAATYTVNPSGRAKDQSFAADYFGYPLAADAAFRAAQPVIHDIQDHWENYSAAAP